MYLYDKEPVRIEFERGSLLLKARSDETRTQIVHILSYGELCACDIQRYFELSQPTLSQHLHVLTESGLLDSRREGKWTHYRLNGETAAFLGNFLGSILESRDGCLCGTLPHRAAAKKPCRDVL